MSSGKYVRTEATKHKIGLAKVGNKYFLGKHHTELTKEKIRLSKLGEKNPIKRFDVKEKHLKAHQTESFKEKIRILKLGNKYWLGKHHSEKTKQKLRQKTLEQIRTKGHPALGSHHSLSEMSKQKIRLARMKQKNFPKHHTKPELKFCKIIKRHNLPYKYTGDGSFWIENINPDFVQTNGKKICVEVWGDYWHNREDMKKKDIERLKTLQKYGWQRVVFWEHELMRK